MPINAGPEYFVAEKRYLEAKTKEEKIEALEEMIRTLPKHKRYRKSVGSIEKKIGKNKVSKTC